MPNQSEPVDNRHQHIMGYRDLSADEIALILHAETKEVLESLTIDAAARRASKDDQPVGYRDGAAMDDRAAALIQRLAGQL